MFPPGGLACWTWGWKGSPRPPPCFTLPIKSFSQRAKCSPSALKPFSPRDKFSRSPPFSLSLIWPLLSLYPAHHPSNSNHTFTFLSPRLRSQFCPHQAMVALILRNLSLPSWCLLKLLQTHQEASNHLCLFLHLFLGFDRGHSVAFCIHKIHSLFRKISETEKFQTMLRSFVTKPKKIIHVEILMLRRGEKQKK